MIDIRAARTSRVPGRRLLLATLAVSLCGAAGLAATGPAAARTSGEPAGHDFPVASAIDVLGRSNAWLVGGYDSPHYPAPLAEHWNGSSWKVSQPTPPGGTWSTFTSVDAVRPGNVWAVGTAHQSFSEHWDGTKWTVLPFAEPAGSQYTALTAISAPRPGDVWAVGRDVVGDNYGLIEHWDGAAWRVAEQLPDVVQLSAVDLDSTTDGWAVGLGYPEQGPVAPVAYRWDGSTWSAVSMPKPATRLHQLQLTGLSVQSPRDAWVVGYAESSDAHSAVPFAEHWDGSAWHVLPTARFGPTRIHLRGVATLSSSNVWAVGDYSLPKQYQDHTLIEHWDGTAWHRVTSPDPEHALTLNAVAGSAWNDIWAVGEQESYDGLHKPGVLHWNGKTWSVV